VEAGGPIAAGSIGVSLLVLVLKSAAWWFTGSTALFSDAAESIVNVASAAMAFGALHLSVKPADANHPYGHAKVEFFAAVAEGGLIVAAALVILQHAWTAWQHPRGVDAPLFGVALNGTASAVNAIWSVVLLRAGQRLRSPALAADGRHLLTDVITSLTLIAGIGLVVLTGVTVLDPLLAAGVAAYILISGAYLIGASVGGLMDAAPSPPVVERIRDLVAEHASGAIEAHDLRTRHAGRVTFLEFHLVVPAAMTVADAHDICDRIEAALRAEMGGLMITIHIEPEGKAKHRGVLVL